MKLLVTLPRGELRDDFFPPDLEARLESLGDVTWNPTADQWTEAELGARIEDVAVCVTGWGTHRLTPAVVERANRLELVAHTGGSVGKYVSGAVYDRGVTVVSANDVMARFTAEHALGAIVAQLRRIPALNHAMTRGATDARAFGVDTLHGKTVALIGLGTIGRYLLEHLRSFDVEALVYDPYVDDAVLERYDFAERVPLEDALATADVVSVHAALTPETEGMLDAERLGLIPDGALFVNTARAEIVEESALLDELRSGRFEAVLDVFHEEPLPRDHELRSLDDAALTPHVGGSQIRPPLTRAVLDDVERYLAGDPLEHEIPREQWETMTR